MGKVIKVKVLFFLLYLLWFTNGTGSYYTWNLGDQALSPLLWPRRVKTVAQIQVILDSFCS